MHESGEASAHPDIDTNPAPEALAQRPTAVASERDSAPDRLSYRSATTPEDAFDGLYVHAAPGLVHQIRLLTGDRGFAFEAVEHAFHHAWEHWPEVACNPDPVGWVRAQAYEYALSPWHCLRPAPRRAEAAPTDPILAALLELPPAHRRIALLCDGLGLSVAEAAAETEASTTAAGKRLLHARLAIGQRVSELDDDAEAMRRTLSALVTEGASATLPSARSTRAGSERRIRLLTQTICALTAAFVAVITLSAVTAPTQHESHHPQGKETTGVPARVDDSQSGN